jgi:hypothetical protein
MNKFRVYDPIKEKYLEYLDDLYLSAKGRLFEQEYDEDGEETGLTQLSNCIVEHYIGICDKEGTDIYEHDVIKIKTKLYLVIHRPEMCAYELQDVNDKKRLIVMSELRRESYTIVGSGRDKI